MSDAPKQRKRPPSRDQKSGKFDAPLGPDQLQELVSVVRAVRDLEPVLAGSVLMFKQLDDEVSAGLASMCGLYLAELKRAALQALQADPESLASAKKLRLDAKVLGNLPISEQQRIEQLARDWTLEGITPAALASARPHVLQSILSLVAHTGLKYTPETDKPGHALPETGVRQDL